MDLKEDDIAEDGSKRIASWLEGLFKRWRGVRSERELQDIIDASEEDGVINEEEGDMLHSIFELSETIVREAMTPRTEMTSCSLDTEFSALLELAQTSGHSRIPVYSGTIDEIVGVVHSQDLLRFWGREPEAGWLRQMLRKPLFVPETMTLERLLREFRRKRARFAIVVDEYGGTSGVITFSDLAEEIVGDVADDDGTEESPIVEEEDGAVVVDGRLNIDELEEYYGMEIPRDKFDTVAGWLFYLLGHIPAAGEEVVAGPLHMTVVASDARRVGKVRIRMEPPVSEEEAT